MDARTTAPGESAPVAAPGAPLLGAVLLPVAGMMPPGFAADTLLLLLCFNAAGAAAGAEMGQSQMAEVGMEESHDEEEGE